MVLRHLRSAALAATLLVGGAGLGFAQTTDTEDPTAPTTERDGGFDWGWLGLLGLIGLAGLRGRRDTDHRTTVSTSR